MKLPDDYYDDPAARGVEDADPFAEPPPPLDFSKPVELADLNVWLLDVAMHFTNAAELIVTGEDATGFRRLLATYATVSAPLARIAATFLPELFEGVEVEGVEIVTTPLPEGVTTRPVSDIWPGSPDV